MKKLFGIVTVALVFVGTAFGAAGDSEETAVSVSFGTATKIVTLNADGEFYFKATLSRSNSYTVWTLGGTTNEEVSVTAWPKESTSETQFEPTADFSPVDEPGGNARMIMYADDWYIDEDDPSESDPKSWVYFIEVEGEPGQKVEVHFQKGVVIPPGRYDNPISLAASSTPTTKQFSEFAESGQTWFKASLKAGVLYSIGTVGGTEEHPFLISLESGTEEESGDGDFTIWNDSEYETDPYNDGYFFTPNSSGYYYISVMDSSASDASVPFGVKFAQLAQRKISEHTITEKIDNPADFSAIVTPGYKNNPATKKYDEIIDDCLLQMVAAGKGARYVVETEGAATNLMVCVYDKTGKMVAENFVKADNTFDARCVFQADSADAYYVGVCQRLSDEFIDVPAYLPVTLRVASVDAVSGSPDEWDAADDAPAGATGLSPLPSTKDVMPETVDVEGHGWHQLGSTDWADIYMIGGRKGITYQLSVTVESDSDVHNALAAEVFYLSGTTERKVSTSGDLNPGGVLSFAASNNTTYYVRIRVKGGDGLDYPNYKVHATAYTTSSTAGELGILTVNTLGVPNGQWTLDKETVKYPGGASILVPSGEHTVKFVTVKGFSLPSAKTVSVAKGTVPTVVEAYYSDTFDPKDDTIAGAVSWSLKNTSTSMSRTLWKNDAEDNFKFTAKDGYYFDFALNRSAGSDAAFKIWNADGTVLAENETSVSQLIVPAKKTQWYITVYHGGETPTDGSYVISGFFANVGAIKLAKTAVSVKENAASVAIAVNRTAKDGRVRVKYGTVAGTAQPGVDYVAQNGILEWANGDNKAKTITVKLIPDLVEQYDGGNKTFQVQLKPIEEDELTASEYPAAIAAGFDVCTVTLTELSKPGVTADTTYATKYKTYKTVAKASQEKVSLTTGTFYGVLHEDGISLTNGMPQLASVTFTASTATPAALSAKVQLGGKNYTFSGKGWDEEESDEVALVRTLELVQKVNNVAYTNTLRIAVNNAGNADDPGAWLESGASVELVMNVPDSNNKGVQEDIHYIGDLYRQNAKVQEYFTVVTNFSGYYTVGLVPEGVTLADGIPAGNGYMTLTVDNKGTVKVAGMLADGAIKPSLSATACMIKTDPASANGYSMFVPVYMAKSPCLFGGLLRLYANDKGDIVVDSTQTLVWNNDNANLSYSGEEGYRIELKPVGGWYDLVVNLQTYYLSDLFKIGTIGVDEAAQEMLATGFSFVNNAEPNDTDVSLNGDAFSTAKKSLVKSGSVYDLSASSNPCNVQVKIARATGIVTGSFSFWSEDENGKQKEISGLKHNGVLIPVRDDAAALDDEIRSIGFFTKALKVSDYNETTKRTTTRSWTFSAPFNVLGIDQGEIDWWAEDWGEQPTE